MKKDFDFKKHPTARAYTLLVYWRFKKIDEELFGDNNYKKRRIEQIQESENTRRMLHQKAIEVLKELGFTEKEGCKILENECERLSKEKLRELKDNESYCGCCRIIIKSKDRDKHQEEEKELHNFLANELMKISKEQTLMRMSIAEDNKIEELIK